MKKIIFGIVAAIAAVTPAAVTAADNNGYNSDVWKYNKGLTLGFITHQSLKDMDSEIPLQYDSSFGISLNSGATYLWPRSAGWAGNRLKVGVDARWVEISYIKYKKFPKLGGVQIEDWMVDPDDYDYDEGDIDLDNISNQQLHLGVGIGPAVAFVPFPEANSALKFLRVNVNAHFNPSASALIYKDEVGDTNLSWAFVPAFDFGMNFQWKNFTLGFEGKWGSAKYNSAFNEGEIEDSFDSDEISYASDEKQSFKNASFRINLGFRF